MIMPVGGFLTLGCVIAFAWADADKAVRPVESTVGVTPVFTYEMPPYSLSVVRLPGGGG